MNSLIDILEKEKAKPILDDEILSSSIHSSHSISYGSMGGSMSRNLDYILGVVSGDIFDFEKEGKLSSK